MVYIESDSSQTLQFPVAKKGHDSYLTGKEVDFCNNNKTFLLLIPKKEGF